MSPYHVDKVYNTDQQIMIFSNYEGQNKAVITDDYCIERMFVAITENIRLGSEQLKICAC